MKQDKTNIALTNTIHTNTINATSDITTSTASDITATTTSDIATTTHVTTTTTTSEIPTGAAPPAATSVSPAAAPTHLEQPLTCLESLAWAALLPAAAARPSPPPAKHADIIPLQGLFSFLLLIHQL